MERLSVLDVANTIVDRLRPGESEAAARVLAQSFAGEPLFAHLFEGCDERLVARAVVPWFKAWIDAYAGCGHVHTARSAGKLVGVGIRVPPGGHQLGGLRKLAFAAQRLASVARMALTSPRALNLLMIGSAVERREPKAPFWLLAWVGVLPEHQRRGVGGALADEAVRVIEEWPAPGWLVTFGAHTRAIYEKRGFVVEAELEPLTAGPVGWTMRRDREGTAVSKEADERE